MTPPLVLLVYEKLLPGSLLVNRLQDLQYRVVTLADADALPEQAAQEKPLLVLADVLPRLVPTCEAIRRMKKNPATAHIPVIAFATQDDASVQTTAREAGATLVATDAAVSVHLKQLVEQALTEF